MKFQPGHEKRGGKKKGTKNKKTKETLDRIDKVLNILDKTLERDISEMKPNERATLYKDLIEYKIPKLARTEITGENGEAIKIISVGVQSEKI